MTLPTVILNDQATPETPLDDDYELDMRVVETTKPLAMMTCSTSDGCGSTCATTACSTSSYDPA